MNAGDEMRFSKIRPSRRWRVECEKKQGTARKTTTNTPDARLLFVQHVPTRNRMFDHKSLTQLRQYVDREVKSTKTHKVSSTHNHTQCA